MKLTYTLLFFAVSFITFSQIPSNDNVSSPITVTPVKSCGAISGTIKNATTSNLASTCIINNDVFYVFNAKSKRNKITVTPEAGLDIKFSVLEKNSMTELSCVDNGVVSIKEVFDDANYVVGSDYYIRIGSVGTTVTKYTFTICIEATVNDNCEYAEAVTSYAWSSSIYSTSFTTGTNINLYKDVYFSFVPTKPTVILRTYLSSSYGNVDPGIFLFEDCNSMPIASINNNDAEPSGERTVFQNLTVGKKYYVSIGNVLNIDSTYATYAVELRYPTTNDDCGNAQVINSGTSISNIYFNVATPSAGYDQQCIGQSDLFYKYKAQSSIARFLVVPYYGLDVSISVYKDCNGDMLECVDDNPANKTEYIIRRDLVAGNDYYIRIAKKGNNQREDNATVRVDLGPANDVCSSAQSITPSTTCTTVSGDVALANINSPSANCTTYQDVFYKFVATSKYAKIRVVPNASLDAVVTLFSNCSDMNSEICVNNSGIGIEEFLDLSNLIPQQTYYIKVASAELNPNAGSFSICILSPPSNDECGTNVPTVTPSLTKVNTSGNLLSAKSSNNTTGCVINNDVYYKFVATHTKLFLEAAPSANLDIVVGLKDNCSNTALLYCEDSKGLGVIETLTLNDLIVGNTYYLSFGSKVENPSSTTFTFNLTTPVANDVCTGAVAYNNGVNTNLNKSTTSITNDCVFYNDVFYTVNLASQYNKITVQPESGLDIGIAVYSACGSNALFCINKGGAGQEETIELPPSSTNYILRVGTVESTSPLSSTFSVSVMNRNNDEKVFARPLMPNSMCVSNVILQNYTQSAEPFACQHSTDITFAYKNDAWYKFVATSSSYNIEASRQVGNVFSIQVEDTSGNNIACYNSSVQVGSTSPSSTISRLLSGLNINDTYYIRLTYDGFGNSMEPFAFCLGEIITLPSMDNCQTPFLIEDNQNLISSTLKNATNSTNNIACYTAEDIYFEFEAQGGSVEITVSPKSNDVGFSVLSICDSTSLVCVNDFVGIKNETAVLNNLIIGKKYLLQISNRQTSIDGDSITISFDYPITTLINSRVATTALLIHPNPAVDIMNINLKGEKNIFISDVNGILVLNEKTTDNTINIDRLMPGVYIIDVHVDGVIYRNKLVKISY